MRRLNMAHALADFYTLKIFHVVKHMKEGAPIIKIIKLNEEMKLSQALQSM